MSSSQPTVAKDSLLKPAQQDTGLSNAIELLQDKIANIYPMARLKEAMVTEAQWFQFVNEMEERNWKQLTSLRFNHLAEQYLSSEQTKLIQVQKRNPARNSRPQDIPKRLPSTLGQWRRRAKVIDKENNPLTANARDLSSPQKTQLEKTGCRITSMSTPKKMAGKVTIAKTPGKTQQKLSFIVNGLSFYQPITPNKPKPKKPLAKHKSRYLCTRKEHVTFTVTREKIQKRKGKRKYTLSQKSLTKASAQDIFNYHGLDFTLLKGAKHLEHIIGFVLGGEHDHTNIFAGTAVSNYTIRDLIELYIVDILSSHKTDEVHLDVEIGYEHEGSDIPLVLNYTVQWQEIVNGEAVNLEETIAIYPQSTTRFDRSARSTLELARELSLLAQNTSSDSDLIEAFDSLSL